MIPSLVDVIGECEAHPEVVDAESDVDYAAIYEAIGSIMVGDVPKELNKPTSQKLLDMMGRLLQEVRGKSRLLKDKKDLLHHRHLNSSTPSASPLSLGDLELLNSFELPSSMFREGFRDNA